MFMKLRLVTCLILCSFVASGQNITFSDLISMVNKTNWESVNQILMNKGWTYYESSEEDLKNYGKITWSYGMDYFDKAKGWMWLYTLFDSPRKISFQFHTKNNL